MPSVSFFSIIALHFSLVTLRNEPSGSMTSAQAQKDTTLQVIQVSAVAIVSCTSDHRCLVTPMELFLLLLFDVLKQNVELRKQLRNEGCGSVFSLPTVTHISNEACGRPLNSYVSVSPSIKWKWQYHTLCRGFLKLANQCEEI